MNGSHKFVSGKWKGLVRNGWLEQFGDIEQLLSAGVAVVDKPGRTVRRIETARAVIYCKWICSAGRGQGEYFLKSLLRQPRSLAVWHVSEAMLAAGIACPLPLLAASLRTFSRFRFEDITVSAEIPYPRVNDLLREAKDTDERVHILRQAGQGIRELHEKGFVHGDCLPGNICMEKTGKLFFLDNDRTVQKSGLFVLKARLRNLVQFCSHTLTVLPNEKLLSHFLDSYKEWEGSKKVPGILRKAAVIKKLQCRVAELEKEFGKKFPGCKL